MTGDTALRGPRRAADLVEDADAPVRTPPADRGPAPRGPERVRSTERRPPS